MAQNSFKLYFSVETVRRPGLTATSSVISNHLGSVGSTWQVVHVAGSKGKGSIVAFLSSILTAAGVRSASYTRSDLPQGVQTFRVRI